MEHYYGFVDHSAVDHLWSMSWQAVSKRYPNKWIRSRLVKDPGAYSGESLRALLAFAVDYTGDVDNVLEHGTVKNTLRWSSPVFWTMAEVIANTLPKSAYAMVGATIGDATPIVDTAIRAFHQRKISAALLWAVLKLHSRQPPDSDLEPAKLPFERLFDPVYRWQGKESFSGDEDTNCLNAADTRRFIQFVARAHAENWSIAAGPRARPFRDIDGIAELVKVTTRSVPRMTRPFVYRMWE